MQKSLSELKCKIISSDHTVEEWLSLDREVNDAIQQASEEEIQEFVDSGAGELLDMTCSAIRSMRNNS